MSVNLPANVRQLIYIVTMIASPTMAYLDQQGTISDFVFGLFSVVVSSVVALAAINVKDKYEV